MIEKLNRFSWLLLVVLICAFAYQMWESKKARDNPQLDPRVQKAIEESIAARLEAQLAKLDYVRPEDLSDWGDAFHTTTDRRFADQAQTLQQTLDNRLSVVDDHFTALDGRVATLDGTIAAQIDRFDDKIAALIENTAVDAASIAVSVASKSRPMSFADFVVAQARASAAGPRSGENDLPAQKIAYPNANGTDAPITTKALDPTADLIQNLEDQKNNWRELARTGTQKFAGLTSSTERNNPRHVLMERVHFDPSSDALSPGGKRRAVMAAAQLKDMPVKEIRLVGYSDTVGRASLNYALSERRAQAVADILRQAGLPQQLIKVVARGENDLPEPTGDRTAEPLNRCVGIIAVTE